MAAYLIAQIEEVTDPTGFNQYREQVGATITRYDGRYLGVGPAEQKEGRWAPGAFVLVEFPSIERAREWYDSDAYRPLKELRARCTRTNLVFLNGM